MYKHEELSTPNSCLNAARPNELVFVIRAKDPLAAQTVRLWADMAEGSGLHEPDKVDAARKWADMAEEQRTRMKIDSPPIAVPPANHWSGDGVAQAYTKARS